MANQLIHASSPYLLQHAHNPVDWQEWSDAAFEQARHEDKLVLVSIGYASCHWCHVMAHESFEDNQTAAIMNDHFVCIKVDREERPDIDQYCMDAVQLITGSGGWPLNCFLLPDGRPLHGGTYFRTQDWQNLLLNLSLFYKNEKEQSLIYATNLVAGVKDLNQLPLYIAGPTLVPEIDEWLELWVEQFDPVFGGFHWAPKFPMPVNLNLFLDYGIARRDQKYTNHVHLTLERMAAGGIHDQSGGGFARYSTDAYWKVPHFEKMLYDNAQLMSLYAKAFMHNKNADYLEILNGIHEFVQRELTTSQGLFMSSLDADSEGIEGLFYCWKQHELENLLGDDFSTFKVFYDITEEGNWEHELNVLHRSKGIAVLANELQLNIDHLQKIIRNCHSKLMAQRTHRVRPATDDKVIASWNALMIEGYAQAYMATSNKVFLEEAVKANAAMDQYLFKVGDLYRILRLDLLSVPGFADDYACLIAAKLKLYEATGDESYAQASLTLLDQAISMFYDKSTACFKYNAKEDKQISITKTELRDDVIPSSNGIFGEALLKLGYLFDRFDFHELLDGMLKQVLPLLHKQKALYPSMLRLMQWRQEGFYQLVTNAPIPEGYYPGLMLCRLNESTNIPLLKEKVTLTPVYFLCKDKVCNLPVYNQQDLFLLLESNYK